MAYGKKLSFVFDKNLDKFIANEHAEGNNFKTFHDRYECYERWEFNLESLGCDIRPSMSNKKDFIRIEHPARRVWIFVPQELAEKILVLGDIPNG